MPDPYDIDPYGEAIHDIKEAITKALSYQGSMSSDEHAILISIEEFVRVADNA